jgi:trans-aconitate 2-methyltransferase
MAWDPKTYLAYGAERTRPAADLLARIPVPAPRRVADLGCGPGNSTALLRDRWPGAEIDGIDNSPEMLKDARALGLRAQFAEADIASWHPDKPYDVIYSNAALQWVAGHETLIPRLLSFVKPGGALALQVPRNFGEACHRLIREAIQDPRWRDRLKDVRDWWNVLEPETYYDLLAPLAGSIDLWETRYFHVLEGRDAVFNWMMGTGLRPFAAALWGEEREEFVSHIRAKLAEASPPRQDGKTIYRFLRLFLVVSP